MGIRVRRRVPQMAAALLMVLLVAACDTTPGPTLYEGDPSFREDPVINSMEPANSSLAGIGTLTINGENFAEAPSDNLVYFNDQRVAVISSSSTELVVESPNIPQSDIEIRLTVLGAEHFSNTVTYTLEAAVEEFGDVADFEESYAIATDEASNVYASLFANNASIGIKRILPDGTREDYIETTFRWEALGFGADGRLYGVRNVRAVFRFPEGGGPQEVWAVADDQSARFSSLAVDDNGLVWVGGAGGNIYSIDETGAMTAVPFEGNVRALAAHDGFLYAAALVDEAYDVLRFPISNGTLGASEEIFDVTGALGAEIEPLSLAVTENGAVFVGTTAEDPLVLIEPDGTYENFYSGLLNPPAFSLAWGEGTTLYMSRTDVSGEPSRIISINTQREGSR